MQDIHQMANDLGLAIKASPEFTAYESAKKAYEEDEALQRLIGEYNLKRQSLILENGKDESERDAELQAKLQREMRALYNSVMENGNMRAYVDSKNKLDAVVSEVFDTLNYHITGQRSGGCAGGCASCHGCH